MHVRMYVLYACMYVGMYVFMYVCSMYVCMYVSVYVCMYVCIWTFPTEPFKLFTKTLPVPIHTTLNTIKSRNVINNQGKNNKKLEMVCPSTHVEPNQQIPIPN